MAALTQDRNTPRAEGDIRQGEVALSTLIYAGALVMRNTGGYIVEGQAGSALVGVGVAMERVDNSAGGNGAKTVDYRPGIFRFENSAGADEIARTNIGDICYVVDDQTVALTNGSSTRGMAGVIDHIDAQGVWVRLDEALTNAS